MKRAVKSIKIDMLGKLFFTYICIFILPLTFAVVLYLHTVNLLKEEAKERNSQILEQARITTEGQIREMELLISRIVNNNNILQFMNLKNPSLPEKIGLITSIWKDFSYISFADGIVEEYYIWFKEHDYIITSDGRYTSHDYYRSYIEKPSSLTYDQWIKRVTSKENYISYGSSYQIEKRGVICPVMDFSLSLPFGSHEDPEASIHVLLSQKTVKTSLSQFDVEMGDEYYILTPEKEIITSKTNKNHMEVIASLPEEGLKGYYTKIIDNEEMLVSYERSTKNGWIYMSIQPMKNILHRTEQLRNIFLIMLAVCVAAGAGFAGILSWWVSFPIRKMLRQIREYRDEAANNEKLDMVVLENAIIKLIDENEYVRKEIQQHYPVLKNNFVLKLLQGKFYNAQEIELSMEQLGIALMGKNYAVLLIYISGYKGAISREILTELSGAKAVIHGLTMMNQLLSLAVEADIEDNVVAYVVPFKEEDGNQCRNKLLDAVKEIKEDLLRAADIQAACFTGEIVDSMARIDLSYAAARQKMDRYVMRGELVEGDPDMELEVSHNHYSYSMENELRLIFLCRDGNADEVRELLDLIYESNFKTDHLNRESLLMLLNELKGTVYKLLDYIPMSKEIQCNVHSRLEQLQDCDFQVIHQIFSGLCLIVKDNRCNQSEKLKQDLIDYIGENYCDNEFYMVTLAEHFNLSESYLSGFMKEQLKVNFSVYLQNLRLSKACSMLENTQKNIDFIAAECGYSSSHVFRRAFKRQYGVTPIQYRECQRKNKKGDL